MRPMCSFGQFIAEPMREDYLNLTPHRDPDLGLFWVTCVCGAEWVSTQTAVEFDTPGLVVRPHPRTAHRRAA